MTEEPVAYTTADVARELDVSPRRVHQLEASGELSAKRTPGGVRLFDPRKVKELKTKRAQARKGQ